MVELSDFRKGTKVLIEGVPWVVVDFQHVKPGKGNQFTRTKLKNLLTGSNLERTFKSGEKFEIPDVVNRDMTFLYKEGTAFMFMDKTSYDQIGIEGSELGDATLYLTENLECTVLFFNGKAIGADVPRSVNLKITRTDPGLKGNTVSGGGKPATLETGHVVSVPLHLNEGDVIRVDTGTGKYIERVSS
ncbi:MAG: elongation factor P [Bdellovibrionales bacterium]